MALTIGQRNKIRQSLHQAYCQENLPIPWTKPNVDAAIDATDAWLIANQASFAAALPQPFRGSSTVSDKAILFITVAAAQRLLDAPEHVAVLQHIVGVLADIVNS